MARRYWGNYNMPLEYSQPYKYTELNTSHLGDLRNLGRLH
jgi:hypothetical protein